MDKKLAFGFWWGEACLSRGVLFQQTTQDQIKQTGSITFILNKL